MGSKKAKKASKVRPIDARIAVLEALELELRDWTYDDTSAAQAWAFTEAVRSCLRARRLLELIASEAPLPKVRSKEFK